MRGDAKLADLLVRGVEEDIVRALEEQPGIHGRRAEAEHREILRTALRRPGKRNLAEVLRRCPMSAGTQISSASNPATRHPVSLIDTLHLETASATSLAMVLMFRAVPFAAAGILSFERPMPAP